MGESTASGQPGEGDQELVLLGKIRLKPEQTKELFLTCPLPVWIWDTGTLRILDANSAAMNMYGYSREEFLGKTVPEIMPPAEARPFLESLKGSSKGFSRIGIWRQQSKAGKLMDVELMSAALTIDGRSCRVLVGTEITERRWAEQLLLEVHAHTEHELGSRTMELDAVAQELQSFAQALLKLAAHIPAAAAAPGEKEVGRSIEEFCERLLCLSRMTYRQMRPQDVDLSAMARDVADEMRRASPLQKVEFRIQEGIHAQADPEFIRMALVHLFRNALVHSRRSAFLEIEFAARWDEQEVVCYVRDNGVGFASSMAEKIFLPFQSFGPEQTGQGIGLSMVRRVVAKHSGRTWAEGAPNQGATFYFTLPRPARNASNQPPA